MKKIAVQEIQAGASTVKHTNGSSSVFPLANQIHVYRFILSDGTSVGIAANAGKPNSNIFVDLDGPKKGRNTYGIDIFMFLLWPQKGGIIEIPQAGFSDIPLTGFTGDDCRNHTSGYSCGWWVKQYEKEQDEKILLPSENTFSNERKKTAERSWVSSK